MSEHVINTHKSRNKSITLKTNQVIKDTTNSSKIQLTNNAISESNDVSIITKKKMNNILLMWVSYKDKQRIIILSKGFHRWKYLNRSSEVLNTNDNDNTYSNSSITSSYKTNEHKNNYLLLFAENEKLRSQLTELRYISTSNETKLKQKSFVTIIKIFTRSLTHQKKRYYYDLWMNNAKTVKFQLQTNRKVLELESGLQYVDSERNYIKTIEVLNSQLKLSLSIAIYFFKWKSSIASLILTEERKTFDQQRKLIFNELIRIRKIVSNSNKQEHTILANALYQGEVLNADIDTIYQQLHKQLYNIIPNPNPTSTGTCISNNNEANL